MCVFVCMCVCVYIWQLSGVIQSTECHSWFRNKECFCIDCVLVGCLAMAAHTPAICRRKNCNTKTYLILIVCISQY